ncbi:MAG: NADH-quinone oxidoreductase subunit C [Promethearchaeota archaeon]
MNNGVKEFIQELEKEFDVNVEVQRDKRLWVTVDSTKLTNIIKFVKIKAFDHLSTISATDWLEEKKFEITYHLWSYSKKVLLTIKTKINRDQPVIESINEYYGTNAESCEREIHELFGVEFTGNPNLTSLFLEDWEGPPPFRKDFDWREYVRETFYDIENPREKIYFED